jgi:hypothetical protein
MAPDVGAVYKVAELADWTSYTPVKFGVIIPGHHTLVLADKDVTTKKKKKK